MKLRILVRASLATATATVAALAANALQAPREPRPASPQTAVQRDLQQVPAFPADLDDSVPLPQHALGTAGPDGDQLASGASGDPYFLGFAAEAYYPPSGESIDPLLASRLLGAPVDGRPTPDTYAFVMFQRRITESRQQQLEQLGARILGFHPHYTLKVALPPTSVDQVAALDFVRWIGVPRPWQKVHPALADSLQRSHAGQWLDVYVDVFESDIGTDSQRLPLGPATTVGPEGEQVVATAQLSDRWITRGWMQSELERLGLEVGAYDAAIGAFRARMLPPALEGLLELDFVQFVESVPLPEYLHDESMPMINADDARNFYSGGTNQRSVVGHVDSGLQYSHTGLNHIAGVGWDVSGAGSNPFTDGCGHGSHTAGTILGDGAGTASLKGVAPGLGWGGNGRVFVVKLSTTCTLPAFDVNDVISHLKQAFTDGGGAVTQRPHVTNNSWGTSPPAGGWIGSEADARAYDNNAYTDAQLSVFSSGNSGSAAGTVGLPGAAKNVLTVGSVVDFNDGTVGLPGSLWTSSSRGPCGDGRWKPGVVAPGRWITSVDYATSSGFKLMSGTSMAAPHVTGAVATLIDFDSFYAYRPELIAARLMATAHRRNDAVLTYPTDTHLDEYGTGRIDLTRAIWGSGGSAADWAFSLGGSSWTYRDFTVPTGATKLVVVMQYVEPAASAGASKALVNDWDLYIDAPPLDPAGNVGDYFAHQSTIDNTEIRVIDTPAVGTWRFKVWPTSVTGSAYFGLACYAATSDTTPAVTVTTSANDSYVRPGDPVQITTSVSTQGGSASAVFLDSTSSGDTLSAASTTLKDGAVSDLLGNEHNGRDIELGNVDPYFSRSAKWTTSWSTEGIKSFSVSAKADNISTTSDGVTVYVDATPPALPTNLVSTSHTVNAWSNDPSVDFTWTASVDNVSGVDGYGEAYGSTLPVGIANTKDMEEVTSFTRSLPDGSWYWALRPVDYCGNWHASSTAAGPYKIDTVAPAGPGVITSTTHTPGVQSCNTNVTISWSAATDATSGLVGYRGAWDTNPTTDPSGTINLSPTATGQTLNLGSSSSPRYFHLRAKDNAGNWGTTRHFGPVLANAASVATYCTAKTNSLGCVPAIGTNGVQPDKSAGNFTVTCSNVLNQKFGLLFWGYTSSATPFQGGIKCVAQPTQRTGSLNSGGSASGADCTGAYAFNFSTAYMNAHSIVPGQTVYAQFWMRDPASPSTTGLSNAVRFTVCE